MGALPFRGTGRSRAVDQVCPPLARRPPGPRPASADHQLLKLPFPGVGAARDAAPFLPAQRGPGAPRAPAETTFLVFGKKNAPVPAQGAGARAPEPRPGFRPPPGPTVKRSPAGPRGPRRQARAGATHPTWEREAGSCWRCVSTGRCAAATGPQAAPGPWQPPPLRIDRPERARRASAPRPADPRGAAVRPDVAPQRVAVGEARGARRPKGAAREAGPAGGCARGVSSGRARE